jgi:hypothetical protein
MKYTIQLYVNGERVEMFNDENVNITSSIQNVRDIGKVFADYSQSFSVPASRQNNKIFKHYYNPDLNNGFDARFKADAIIEINYQAFKTGKVALTEVEMRDNKAYAYKLTFYGGIVSLKDIIGDDQLEDLNWLSNFNTDYTYLEVRTRLQNGKDFTVDSVSYPDAIITPLISAEERWYYSTSSGSGNLAVATGSTGANYTNMKYAIRLYCIIKAIEEKYNTAGGYPSDIVFSNDFFSTSENDFYNLYMWLHREKGKVDTTEPRSTYLNKFPVTSWSGTYWNTDNFQIFGIGDFQASKYEMDLTISVSDSGALFDVFVEQNGSVIKSYLANTGSSSYSFSTLDLTTNGTYKVRVQHTTAFNVTSTTNIVLTRYDNTGTSNNTFIFTGTQSLTTDIIFDVNLNIPKMKVIDFLTALFNMFNLTAYSSGGQIVVKPLDDFYASGSTIDITKYTSSTSSSVFPANLYREISFKYSDTKSLLADNHLEQFNFEWGNEEYNIENRYDGGTYTISVPFSHYKYERLYEVNAGTPTVIQWGWAVDKLNDDGTGQPYLGSPLVFYAIQQTGTNIRVTDGTTPVDIGTYYIPSNSLALTDTDTNINFKAELNEYTNSVFENTLFQTYYSNYIEDLYDYRTRFIKVSAQLPLSILITIKLEDTIILNQREYRINQVEYSLTEGKANFELQNKIN